MPLRRGTRLQLRTRTPSQEAHGEAGLSHQAARITQGVHNGSLTAAEAKALVSQQKDLYKDLFQAKTDNGFVGPHERRELRHELRQASRDIFIAKHNCAER